MSTQVEIARMVGLDVSSVNKILNDAQGPVFKEETKAMVRKMAKKLGYKPKSASKGMMRKELESLFPRDVAPEVLAIKRSVGLGTVTRIRTMLYKL